MEYGKTKPLASAPAPEPTAFTMKTIHEILAETGDENLLQKPPQPAPEQITHAPKPSQIQRPPAAAALAAINAVDDAQVTQEARNQPCAMQADSKQPIPQRPTMKPATTQRPQEKGLAHRLTKRLFGRG